MRTNCCSTFSPNGNFQAIFDRHSDVTKRWSRLRQRTCLSANARGVTV
jgi:hypothetical protein